jgi:ATP-binding cassette subfamily F protein 3
LQPTGGTVTWADNIKKAYFDQHAHFEPGERPIAIVMKKLNCFDEEARAALGAMRFNLDTMNTPVELLSGGERMRLRFALVFGLKPDLIILDEPTNHLDEVTWEVLLEACKASKSTILLVSHDYEFIQEFNPGIFWVVRNQSVTPRSKSLTELLGEMSS